MTIRSTLDLLSEDKAGPISQVTVPYKHADLAPVISAEAFDFHYGKLYKKYVDGFNAGENKKFNLAGAYLHGVYFSQLTRPGSARPHGASLDLINKHFGNFIDFKKSFQEVALKQTGSYWVYLSTTGQIKVIQNHEKRSDIAVLIDMWEHSWMPDAHDKKKFLNSIWKIINWDIVNQRL
jgi:superoxide dismutase, Fe-Mn family